MIKLKSLYNEIKVISNKIDPSKNLLLFLKTYWSEIADTINNIDDSGYFDPYDEEITFEEKEDEDINGNEYELIIAFNSDGCGAAWFTSYQKDLNKESDEGPFSGWGFIRIKGFTIQYATSGC